MAEPPSSPPSEAASAEDALSWYKSQYVQLEADLADFRESSRELEQELEKDIERAEKQERVLQEKAETLAFEVEEWKRKYKESKLEAGSAQAALEKEITTLRDSNRTYQLKIRDIEVANDDFERQARNTTSSLEDMESKYNQAIERGVMMEEEIKQGEQERENLRIESQRLREELSDLKIEAELLQDKIKKQESRHLSTISTDLSVLSSPTFDKNGGGSPLSTASSPLVTTPPDSKPNSTADADGEDHEPPSPPMSDVSLSLPRRADASSHRPTASMSSAARKTRLPSASDTTPKPRPSMTNMRPPSGRLSGGGGVPLRTPANRSTKPRTGHKLPASNSLTHIRVLTAQMQRLEARVHSVRSRLPAPTFTPPRASPRGTAANVPSTVTMRSRKRTTGSTASSVAGDDTTPTNLRSSTSSKPSHVPRLSTSGVSRLSYGPLPNRAPDHDSSRPSSRASVSSIARPVSRTEMNAPPRPVSRTSLSGARTPLGRPRSSLGGSYHGHSASVGYADLEEEEEEDGELQTPSRQGTYSKFDPNSSTSSIPGPSASGIPMPSGRRSSTTGRRASNSALRDSISRPRSTIGHKLQDLGETY
ncbi:unnamed protein product [Clonostachys byssicola]|uniref:NUDE domain-containing protein n=1 Tax=Clonostachys byssicola TaxID=160290 RepID=A0A9N9Y0K9_9HYPO|nr:unnamed protein product [Clonostachys byssicola]